jgi:hypothetical protein
MNRPLTPLPDFQPICLAPNRGNPTSPSRGEVWPLHFRLTAAAPHARRAEVLPLAVWPAVFVPSPLEGEGQGEG